MKALDGNKLALSKSANRGWHVLCSSPSVPASRFHTAIHGVRLCLRLGVHALAIPVPSSLANAKSPGDSSRGRILLRHCGGIVPPLSSSNVIDNATHHLAASSQHWNTNSGSAGLEALLLRRRRLPGGSGSISHPSFYCGREHIVNVWIFDSSRE
jgi:hypothetical protein